MAYVRYEDSLVTEYSDGTEEVRFTEAEQAAMAADPVRFGLVRRCGHAFSLDRFGQPVDSDCLICEYAGEAAYEAEMHEREEARIEAEIESARAFDEWGL